MLKHAIAALGTLVAGLPSFSVTQASAFTAPLQSAVLSSNDQLIVEVRARGGGRYGGYSGHYNGYRNYGHRNYGYRPVRSAAHIGNAANETPGTA